MTLEELYAAANVFCSRNWGVDYTGSIRFVPRKWKSVMAQFWPCDSGIIQMSAKTNAEISHVRILDNLHHELVHWRLWSEGLPYDDADRDFVAESVRVGASISGTNSAKEALVRYISATILEERIARRKEDAA